MADSSSFLILLLGIVELDPYLTPFEGALRSRYSKTQQWIKTINAHEGGLEKFSRVRVESAKELLHS